MSTGILLLLCFAAGTSLTVVIGHFLLPLLIRLKVGQSIRAEGPQKHLSKSGTPTMGGLIFIAAMLIILIWRCRGEAYQWMWLFSFLAFGLIGFLDDFIKVVRLHNKGLSGKQKLVGQFAAAVLLLVANQLCYARGTAIYLPSSLFQGAPVPLFDLGWFYYPLMAVFMVGMVNAVNLTDGLDGLAAGVTIPASIGFMICGLLLGGDMGKDVAVLAAALAGCCLGFLFYNHYPARLFMGDTGSMALGGALAGFTLISRLELLFIGFGLVYLIEACSVMLQVASFQLTGKRIFLMSPLHHHFELKGWRETKVTAVFCLASACFVFITLLLGVL
ncbi:MAG: phospho-N-acetylmuramoyl-pentapeptide-transferase [Firmicutes bacterium]|nr:phospho-N-acetylmuramoyl-pentapeptide-transferase [Bacillota bacterium]